MINELDLVVLTEDVPDFGLQRGDVGTVVHVYGKPGYEVEFLTLTGDTIAVVTLAPTQIRLARAKEVMHARPVA